MPRAARPSNCIRWIATEHYVDDAPCFLTLHDHTKFHIFGREVCPSTGQKHYQCYFELREKKRLTNLKTLFGNHIHFEAAVGTADENIAYCSKDGDFELKGEPTAQGKRNDLMVVVDRLLAGEDLSTLAIDPAASQVIARHMQYFNKIAADFLRTSGLAKLKERMAAAVLRPWQSRMLDVVTGPVHDRSVYWIHEPVGNVGKSFFANYLVALHGAVVFTGGKLADIAHAYRMEPVVIFDLSRTQSDKIDHVYAAIENFKNGRFFSPKYQSETKVFDVPHVLVMANWEPNMFALSSDRWVFETCQ